MATMVLYQAAAKVPTVPSVKLQWKCRRNPARMAQRKPLTVAAITAHAIKHVDVATSTTPTWAVSLCDHLERAVMSWAVGDAACEKDEVCYLLEENYAPVPEMAPTTELPITGTIPACLNGQFLRNGPNPRFQPVGRYHWFDGDGMIHGLSINDGKATYAARYVQTSRLVQEERYGAPKFLKIGDLIGVPGYFLASVENLRKFLGILDDSKGVGTGNTALVFHNHKLLALHERDRPYSIKVLEDGDLQTISVEDYGQKLDHPVTAHPKIDPITGEMFIFAYELVPPGLIYRVISKNGVVGEPVQIKLPSPVMMHDFAISENYAIFMDLPVCVNPLGLAAGDFIFKFNTKKESRLGILPRYATEGSQIRWFEIPPCFIAHTVNAWEEGDEVVLTCCRKESVDFHHDREFKPEKAFGVGSRLYEFRINLKSGEVKQKQLSNLWADFPSINPEYTGRKVRYAYCAVFDEQDKIKGVAKFDLSVESSPRSDSSGEVKAGGNNNNNNNIAGLFHYGASCAGDEAIFVPRKPAGTEPRLEDDGYLISFVHDINSEKSKVVVIDAKTMEAKPVAVVMLPRRVPHGFHAYFVSQEQLRLQA